MRPRIGVTCSTLCDPPDKCPRRLQVPEAYVRRVEEAGGLAILLPIAEPSTVADYLRLVDGVLLIGGDDVDPSLYGRAAHARLGPVDRARDLFEIALVRRAAQDGVPTLGICRGVQVMNVALGGTLLQHLPDDVPGCAPHAGFEARHAVDVVAGTVLERILGGRRASVNSSHHQAIDGPAPSLAVAARSADGVVEAAESRDHPFLLGVQWHPERMAGEDSTRRLFHAFLEAAGKSAVAAPR